MFQKEAPRERKPSPPSCSLTVRATRCYLFRRDESHDDFFDKIVATTHYYWTRTLAIRFSRSSSKGRLLCRLSPSAMKIFVSRVDAVAQSGEGVSLRRKNDPDHPSMQRHVLHHRAASRQSDVLMGEKALRNTTRLLYEIMNRCPHLLRDTAI